MDYYDLASALTRLEAAPTLAKLASKHAAIRRIAKPRRKTWDFETVVYVNLVDGDDYGIEVGISYDATYEPAYITGLPEDCYPDGSEMDIHDVVAIGELPAGITEAMVMAAAEYDRDRLEGEAWEHFHDQRSES